MSTIAERAVALRFTVTAKSDHSQGQPGVRVEGVLNPQGKTAEERYGFSLAQAQPLPENWAGAHGGGVLNQVTPERVRAALGADTPDPEHDEADLQYIDRLAAEAARLAGIVVDPSSPDTVPGPGPVVPAPFEPQSDRQLLEDIALGVHDILSVLKQPGVDLGPETPNDKALTALRKIGAVLIDFEKKLGDRSAHDARTMLATVASLIAEGGA